MKQATLSQLATVSAGQAAPKDDEFSDYGISFVRAGSLDSLLSGKSESDLELVSDETAKLRKLKTYPKGTILFAKSGMSATKDRIYVLQNPAYVVSHLATLIPNGNAYADYLRLALKRFPPSVLIKDPAYPSISLGDIQGYEIPVPEQRDDQIRIAHLLGKVEGLIAQRKQHLQQLDDLIKGVFLEMFGDPVRNEKGWVTSSLSAYGAFKNGLNFGRGETGATVRYLGVGNFKSKARLDDIDGLAFIELNELPAEDYFLQDGDLLFVRSNGNRELVGRCMAVYPGIEKVTYSGFCIRYRINDPALQATYIAHLFRSAAFRKVLFQGGQGANIQNINQQTLSGLPIPVPAEGLQKQFAVIVEKVEGIKSKYRQSLTELESLYGALSQQAFKGELDLSRVSLPEAPESQNSDMRSNPKPQTEYVAINLPKTDLLLLALNDREQFKPLLHYWLEAYIEQLGEKAFLVEEFIRAAEAHAVESQPDREFELGAEAYDLIKVWLFEALSAARLDQVYPSKDIRVALRRPSTRAEG